MKRGGALVLLLFMSVAVYGQTITEKVKGMEKFPGLPFPASLLRKELWVSEVVYVPLETELLAAARRAGCRLMDGGHMNVGQALLAFGLFTGREADPRRVEAHFRREIQAAPR